MAGFAAIVLALASCMCFGTTAQASCSTGTRGLSGCECNFLGACDVRGNRVSGLNILRHSPYGLEQYAHAKSGSGKDFTFLCEGGAVAILYDCNNRIPLYAATVVNGSQLSAEDGHRPTGGDGTFRESRTTLDRSFQQKRADYRHSAEREVYYKKRGPGGRKEIDRNWYRHNKLNPTSSSCGEDKVVIHKGHLIASRYGIGDQEKKKQTFVYTNAVPQFGVFNSGPWKTCEGYLIEWGKVNCLMKGRAANVRMFIVVGAIPSTFFGPSKTRFFGRSGFSNYQDDTNFRVNVPSEMWTASCCTFKLTRGGRTYSITKNTAFWRENVPGKDVCQKIDVGRLERKLTPWWGTRINFFRSPNRYHCRSRANYKPLY